MMLAPKIVYENDRVLVIDKPAGMVVNQAESVKQETLQDWLEVNFQFSRQRGHANGRAGGQAIFNSRLLRSGIVHRLDKDTSGVMVIAKTKAMFEELQRQFKAREITKTYMALLHGKLEPKEGSMRLPLGRNRRDRQKFTVKQGGKQSETSWRVLEYLTRAGESFSLVELYPKTGRTHQLRVHLKHLGYPIVGDKAYLGKQRAKKDASWCSRQFLHAKKLCVVLEKRKQCFEVRLAKDLEKALGFLK